MSEICEFLVKLAFKTASEPINRANVAQLSLRPNHVTTLSDFIGVDGQHL